VCRFFNDRLRHDGRVETLGRDGKVLWTDRYGDEAFTYGYPARIVASGDGDSFLVGSVETDETWDDFVTLKYEAPTA
jgi:hypothetical protein